MSTIDNPEIIEMTTHEINMLNEDILECCVLEGAIFEE